LALLGQPELGDGLIGAVRGAGQAKWLLLAVALAALGHLAWHTPAAGAKLRRIAALSCATAALALPLGVWWWQGTLGLGMAAMAMAFALLAWTFAAAGRG
jgi:hypothetical protein